MPVHGLRQARENARLDIHARVPQEIIVQQVEVSNVEEHHHWQDRASCCQLRRTDPCVRNMECHWVLLSPSRRSSRSQFRAMRKITTRPSTREVRMLRGLRWSLAVASSPKSSSLGLQRFHATRHRAESDNHRSSCSEQSLEVCEDTQKDVSGVVGTTTTSWRSVTQHGLTETTETVKDVTL